MAKHGFRTFKTEVENHVFWMVESNSLKGCVAQGDTIEQALSQFEINEKVWLETAKEVGIPVPKTEIEKIEANYSGKLSLRIKKSTHKELSNKSKVEDVSVNSLINTYIERGLGNEAYETKLIQEFRLSMSSGEMNADNYSGSSFALYNTKNEITLKQH
jgi:antitoxin HicB